MPKILAAAEKLKEKRGEVTLHMAFLLAGSLLLLMCLQAGHSVSTILHVRGMANAAVLSAAADNVSWVYGGVRESSGVSRRPVWGGWAAYVSTWDVKDKLAQNLAAQTNRSGNIIREDSFSISNVRTVYVNSEGEALNLTTTFDLKMEPVIGAGLFPPLTFPITVRST